MSVVLPASGWEMIAKVRRRAISAAGDMDKGLGKREQSDGGRGKCGGRCEPLLRSKGDRKRKTFKPHGGFSFKSAMSRLFKFVGYSIGGCLALLLAAFTAVYFSSNAARRKTYVVQTRAVIIPPAPPHRPMGGTSRKRVAVSTVTARILVDEK